MLTYTSFLVFLDHFFLGVGYGDNFAFMKKYLPEIAYHNFEIKESLDKGALPSLNYWSDVLMNYGIFYLIVYIMTNYFIFIRLLKQSSESFVMRYFFIAFLFYLLATILQGFNSMNSYFIYKHFMLVFFLIVSVHGRYFNSKICFPRKRM
jgi:hypothetical protein